MRKLMIAAAIVCAAVFGQAAQVAWYTGDISGYNGASSDGYLALFFESATVAQSTVTAALEKGQFTFTSSGFSDGAVADGEAYGTTSAENATTVTGYMVVFNAATTGDATYYYMTDENSGTTGLAGQAASIDFDGSDTAVAANWTKIGGEEPGPQPGGGPEPTSGLLLLLGVAGLALKRKHA